MRTLVTTVKESRLRIMIVVAAALGLLTIVSAVLLTTSSTPKPVNGATSTVELPVFKPSDSTALPEASQRMPLSNIGHPWPMEEQANPQEFVPIPQEWEAPLFAVLEIDADRMPERNAALIAMATQNAIGVKRVQQECLDHLAFGLPDSEPTSFVALATDARIPVELRRDFVEKVLQMRPSEITDALCKALIFHHEKELSQISRGFISSNPSPPLSY